MAGLPLSSVSTSYRTALGRPSGTEGASLRDLRDLFWMRTIAILLEAIAVMVLRYRFDYPLQMAPLAAAIVALSIWNLWSWQRQQQKSAPGDLEFFLYLLPDVATLTLVLYFTGGATNPFAWVYLFPLVIAATVLPRRYAWAMALLTTVCYSALVLFYVPLPGAHVEHHASGFGLHVFGMWFGFVMSAALFAHFIGDLTDNLRAKDHALAAAREKALRDERIVSLGTLAAGAAHELGTPLGTIALLSQEMREDYPADRFPELHERLHLLTSQVERCKESLSVISASSGFGQATSGGPCPVESFLQALIRRWRQRRPGAALEVRISAHDDQAQIIADTTIAQAIQSILDNAADVSPEAVELEAAWDAKQLHLEIRDQGPGLSEMASTVAGKAQFTTKSQGLGLGLFLAHSTIRRLGGEVRLYNRTESGVCTRIELPLL